MCQLRCSRPSNTQCTALNNPVRYWPILIIFAYNVKKNFTLTTRKAHVERRPPPSIQSNVNENPGFLPDQPQNWITCNFCHSLKISERSFRNFLSYLANTQTNKLWQKHNLLGGGNYNFSHLILTLLLHHLVKCKSHQASSCCMPKIIKIGWFLRS